LAAVTEFANNGSFNGFINVSIVKYDEWRISAGLDRYSVRKGDVKKKILGSGEENTCFFNVDDDMPYSNLATGVDPVNVTFLTILFSHISFPTSATCFWVGTTLITPCGTPAC